MEANILFNFVDSPFEENKKLFSSFLSKHSIVKGVDGVFHMNKTQKEYYSFLKKLYNFMKRNDLLELYEKVYGIFENEKGNIYFLKKD